MGYINKRVRVEYSWGALPVAKEITYPLLFYIYTNKLQVTLQDDPKAPKVSEVPTASM